MNNENNDTTTKSVEELTVEAKVLEIDLAGDETAEEIQTLIDDAKKSPEQIAEEGRIAQQKFADTQKAKKDLQKQPEETSSPEGGPKLFTEEQVMEMIKKVLKKTQKDEDGVEDDDDEKPRTHTVRLSRFQNKFIIGLKNMNTDEYFADQVIHAYDLWDDKTRQNVPWVTLILEDNSELAVPLATALKRSTKVSCQLLERKEVDASYDFGMTEKSEVPDGSYGPEGSGQMVKTKVKQKTYSFRVLLPNTGKEVVLGSEVINW